MIEEVGKYKYVRFTFQENGKVEAHIRERARKARGVMREVCGIEKRWFRGTLKGECDY